MVFFWRTASHLQNVDFNRVQHFDVAVQIVQQPHVRGDEIVGNRFRVHVERRKFVIELLQFIWLPFNE